LGRSLSVVVRDAFGNGVPGEPVALRGGDPQMGVTRDGGRTDSLGRATFALDPRTIRRAGRIDVIVREARLTSMEAGYPLSASAQSRFVTGADQVGIAGTQVNAPLVFQARGSSGRPLAGRVIVFSAQNAEVTPDHAVSDGAGLAQVQVTLGPKAGPAIVIASVDSVRTQATIEVRASAPATVFIEHKGVRVDGERLVVPAGAPSFTISARDALRQCRAVAGLAHVLEQMRARFNSRSLLLRMESVQADQWVTTVTFRPVGRGTAPLTLADATVTVEVVGRGGPVTTR
jgi:hypothetical protein